MAAKAVINAKITHPEISLFLLLPYHPAERPIDLPLGFDGSFYPPGMEKYLGDWLSFGQTDIWLIIQII